MAQKRVSLYLIGISTITDTIYTLLLQYINSINSNMYIYRAFHGTERKPC